MATETERPPSRIGKKVNPAYTAWRRAQKAAKPKAVISEFCRGINAPGEVLIAKDNGDGTETFDVPGLNLKVTRTIPIPETLTLRVIGPAKNSNFMLCDHDGEKVAVRIGKRYANRVLGKSIPVRREDDGTYTHAP